MNNCRIIPIIKIKGLFQDGGNLQDVAVDKNVYYIFVLLFVLKPEHFKTLLKIKQNKMNQKTKMCYLYILNFVFLVSNEACSLNSKMLSMVIRTNMKVLTLHRKCTTFVSGLFSNVTYFSATIATLITHKDHQSNHLLCIFTSFFCQKIN